MATRWAEWASDLLIRSLRPLTQHHRRPVTRQGGRPSAFRAHRHDHRSANPRVDYTLTDAGRDLVTTVHGLCDWSRTHLDDLLDAPGAADRV
ncbi:winged helix-turn-helix transcriptional regulator [Gordonia sp. NPDC127522]|uniref:winged helix-turn-helix transcriptional regulator n=1 Tax=Gordonia sp. NPDC127522 TaxID=3345390 RepID=UPI00362D9FFE